MGGKANTATGDGGVLDCHADTLDTNKHSRATSPAQPARLERVLAHTRYVLQEIRRTTRAGALSGELALIWYRHLGPVERCLMLVTAAQAADPADLDALLIAAQRDREPPWPHFGRKHRSPTLTKIEKRRAAAIQFEDTPRAILAAAWAGASDRDRRDLLARATGRGS